MNRRSGWISGLAGGSRRQLSTLPCSLLLTALRTAASLSGWVAVALLGYVAQAAPNPPAAGPRLTDDQLLRALDLTRSDLATVQAAIGKQDWTAARHALAEHFRTRPTPRWGFDPRTIGKDPQYGTADADKAMAHRLSSIGIEWQFGPQIDWSFNPTTQPGSKWPANHEWTWQLSRHPMWLDLARAFYATGNEKYVREFVAQLQSWVHDCPVPLEKAQNVPFSRWRTIEAGIRAGTVWPEIFPRFLAAKSFDDDALLLMVKSFVEHAQYLMKYPTRGNWLTMEANGLYHVGALFPEFQESKLWRQTAADRLNRELDTQVYPDGAQIELAPGYHGVTIRNFLGPVSLVATTGFEPPPGYLPKMERLFDYFLYSMQPNRRTPPLNDSGAGEVSSYLSQGAALFPHRADFRWVASNAQQGHPPEHLSHAFPYAGQFFLRSGWNEQALWLCLDGGPFGFGHQHEDKLSVILTAFGQPLLVEGGVYTYDASDWRRYVLSSRAHNLVLVDGLEQNRRKEPSQTYVVNAPLPHVWETNAAFDHAAARYDEGWGREAKRLVTHTRHVFFLKPDLFVLADELAPQDDRSHCYDTLFHLDASEAASDGLRVTTRNPGPNLTIMASGPQSVSLVKGQKEPTVQGWLPDRAGGYGGIRPIPTAIYHTTAVGKLHLLYVLYPTPHSAPCPVTDVKLDGNTLTVRFTDRAQKVIRFQPMPKP